MNFTILAEASLLLVAKHLFWLSDVSKVIIKTILDTYLTTIWSFFPIHKTQFAQGPRTHNPPVAKIGPIVSTQK